MTILHVNIADADRHEPKGISTATAGQVYVADGVGSGTWRNVKFDEVTGNVAFGSMTITNNAVNLALTAVADTTFNTPTHACFFRITMTVLKNLRVLFAELFI